MRRKEDSGPGKEIEAGKWMCRQADKQEQSQAGGREKAGLAGKRQGRACTGVAGGSFYLQHTPVNLAAGGR